MFEIFGIRVKTKRSAYLIKAGVVHRFANQLGITRGDGAHKAAAHPQVNQSYVIIISALVKLNIQKKSNYTLQAGHFL